MTAWHRRALEAPAPWTQAMRPIERETLVAFYREGSGDGDDFGGFEGEGADSWTIACHVEMQRDSLPVGGGSQPGDTIRRRRWVAYVPLPLDAEYVPRQGDHMAFTDTIGRPVDVLVQTAPWVPEGLADHLRVDSEGLE